jgi:hypothetical protein
VKEKDVQSKFTKWVKENNYKFSAAWELKLCKKGEALAFSAFQPQQLPCLQKAKHDCVYRKISDADRSLKPYDASQICFAEAYVVACWYQEREGTNAYWIDIDDMLEEIKASPRKSLTEKRANEISCKVIKL